MNTLYDVWYYLNSIKRLAVEVLPESSWLDVKIECDDLFRQASGGRYNICPAWFIAAL